MSQRLPQKIIFLDYDGCLTSRKDGNYFNPNPEEYHPSMRIAKPLLAFCKKVGAKVVIASNWRKFDIDGIYKVPGGIVKNPLPEVIQLLGDIYFCTLPADRRITKSQQLLKWFEQTGFDGKYAIFEDDPQEGYQDTAAYGISSHLILVDTEVGISKEDLKNASTLLA